MPRHVGDQRQHRIEIVGQAGGGHRRLVTAGNYRQRRAAAVELVGNHVGGSLGRAAIEDAGTERRCSVAVGRIGVGAGAHADQQTDGRRRVIGFREHRDAVRQHDASGVQRHTSILCQEGRRPPGASSSMSGGQHNLCCILCI
jgi:hypothetical protein